MADRNEKILLQLELDVNQMLQNATDARLKLEAIKKEQKDLTAELKKVGQGSVEYENLTKKIETNKIQQRFLGGELRSYEKQMVLTNVAQKAQEDSLQQLKAQLSLATAEWNKLSKEERENSEQGKTLQTSIKGISDKLKEQEKTIGDTRRNVGNYTETLQAGFGSLAGGLGIGLSIAAVTAFGKHSVAAFNEAEKNANALKFAVVNIAKEGEPAFEKLIQQSSRLQAISIFSDDDIQKAQTALIQYGLTSDEVEKLVPHILDLAAAQNIDLGSATDKVISGINGQTKGLKEAGIAFDDTGSKVQNLAKVTEGLSKFQDASTNAAKDNQGATKQLANAFGDLQEQIGQLLDQRGGIVSMLTDITGGISRLLKSGTQIQLELNVALTQESRERAIGDLDELKKSLQAHGQDASKAAGILLRENQETIVDLQGQLAKAIDSGDQSSLASRILLLKAYSSQLLQEMQAGNKARIDLGKLSIEELKKLDTLAARDELAAREKFAEEKKKLTEKDHENLQKSLDGLKELQKKFSDDLADIDAQTWQEKLAVAKKRDIDEVNAAFEKTDKLKSSGEIRGQALLAIDKKYSGLTKENAQKDFDAAIAAAQKAADEINRIEKEKTDKAKQLSQEKSEFINSLEEDNLQQRLNEIDKQERADINRSERLISNEKELQETKTKITKFYEDARNKIEQAAINNRLQLTADALGQAASLFKEHTAAYKILATAEATISTYLAATKAYDNGVEAGGPYAGEILGPLFAAIAIAAGLANIAKINGVQFYKGGFTGAGNPSEESRALGIKPYIYHKNEYVVPHQVVNNPEAKPLIGALERMRLNAPIEIAKISLPFNVTKEQASMVRSYAIGGFADAGIIAGGIINQTSNVTNHNKVGMQAEDVRAIVAETVSQMRVQVAVQDINDAQGIVAKVEDRANW